MLSHSLGQTDTRSSDSAFRTVFEHSNDAGFVLCPAEDRIVTANLKACELLGYSRDELLRLPISAIHPDQLPRFMAFADSVAQAGSGWTDELICFTKSGEHVDAEISASLIRVDHRGLIVAWVRDIRERRKAESALNASERRFRLFADVAADAMYIFEAETGRFIDVNRQAVSDTGYDRDELLSKGVFDLNVDLAPEMFRQIMTEMEAQDVVTVTQDHRRKDGSTFPVEIRARRFLMDGTTRILSIVRDISDRVAAERDREELGYLRQEVLGQRGLEGIVGDSAPMTRLFGEIGLVARTDSTALIVGETGTGKELVARAVHAGSRRADRALISVNCAALSAGLVESELFGHEKGAFTGAVAQRKGRFELADSGTIFLDEVGDLSRELQAKLLRVLQEGEFDRVGGSETRSVDVRVIAATNRNLAQAVQGGGFRADLYFRLSVVPIDVPPLRARHGDVALLVTHFVREFAKVLSRPEPRVTTQQLAELEAYHWPGNVRELRNVIERAVILTQGTVLELGPWRPQAARSTDDLSLDEIQRRHIVHVLELCGWRVSGPYGAAELLGMKPTTLWSRMKKLGVKPASRDDMWEG